MYAIVLFVSSIQREKYVEKWCMRRLVDSDDDDDNDSNNNTNKKNK